VRPTQMAVKHILTILNFKQLIVVQQEILQNGLNNVNALMDILGSSVNLVLQDIGIVLLTVGHSCHVFLAIVTNMQRFVIRKLEDVFANITQQEIIAINVKKDITEMLLLEHHSIVSVVHVLKMELACNFQMNQSCVLNVQLDISVS
jgi:predicted RecB family endonuclease